MAFMNPFKRVSNTVKSFIRKNSYSPGQSLARDFLRRGNRSPMIQDWSQVMMTDQDTYTSYAFAAINNRANAVAQLATNNIMTDAEPAIMKEARQQKEVIEHPYLKVIDSSTTFSNYKFWQDISSFLDLEGVYYLMVLRNVDGNRSGSVQEFKMLNPFNVRRVINKDTGEVGGYVEQRGGLVRNIPPEMIIEIRRLNPFSDEEPYSLIDAAKDSQFTLKQANDYTRHSLKNNMAAPGIISTDIQLEDQQFINFKSRVVEQEKGTPIFGNGAGAITWQDMQIDMDKAALDKINEINLNALIAVTGNSKTMFGIEQSGVTRNSADVQSDLFIRNHVTPQLQLIIDALNQDYKKFYPDQYASNGYRMVIDSPLGKDLDGELKDVDIRTKGYELYQTLINKGFEEEIAAQYVDGEIKLEEMGEPTNEPVAPPITSAPAASSEEDEEQNHVHNHDHDITVVVNQLEDESKGAVEQQQGALQNAIAQIEQRVVGTVIDKVTTRTNAFEEQSDVISETDYKAFENELEMAVGVFYGIVIPLFASSVLSNRSKETGMMASFSLNRSAKQYIKETASKVAASHMNTIVEDVLESARKAAENGAGQTEIVSAIRQEYSQTISQVRAKTIARTETNRAFSSAQFEADKQFIDQNQLGGRVFKQWITRSSDPCPYCVNMAKQAPIPFNEPFLNLNDKLSYTYRKKDGSTTLRQMVVDFEPVTSGTLHPNCSCTYRLIIETPGA